MLDELNILMLLLEKQNDVTKRIPATISRSPGFGKYVGNLGHQISGRLEAKKADIERLRGEVTQTHDLVSSMAPEPIIPSQKSSLT